MKIKFILNSRIKADSTQNIQIRVMDTETFRKVVTTPLNVFKKHFDMDEFRCKKSHPEHETINKGITKLKKKKEYCLAKFDTDEFTRRQVWLYMDGKSDYNSVDDFINTDYKRLKRDVTFNDYITKYNTIKMHMGVEGKLRFKDIDSNWLEDLFATLRDKGLAKKTIRSYSTALSVILGDAERKGIIDKKPVFPKTLTSGGKRDRKRKELKTTSSEDFVKYIDSIKSIEQWQSFAFWLLSFCLRGFYPADIVKMESSEIKKGTSKWSFEVGYLFIEHLRSKSEHTENEHMLINIPEFVFTLINALKFSVVYTHSKKHRNIVAKRQDLLKIFDYNPSDNYKFHLQRWALHTRRLRPFKMDFKSGRKTYNTVAKGLKIDESTRLILLGRQSDPILARSYDDNTDLAIQNNVFEAHMEVLDQYSVDIKILLLFRKLKSLKNIPNWLHPHWLHPHTSKRKINYKGFEWYFDQPEYEWKIKITKKEEKLMEDTIKKRMERAYAQGIFERPKEDNSIKP